jgi:aromatic-L-amino-acid decarboxylase
MSSGAGAQWRWPESELRRIGYQVADLIAGYLSGIDGQPAFRPFPVELARALELAAPPEAGRTADEVLAEFRETVLPYPFGNGHPRFWAWVNPPPHPIGVFADALAAAMNPSVAGGNHAAVHIEREVVRWFADLAGFPVTSFGLFTSGGSMATLTALATARHQAAARLGFDVRAGGMAAAPAPLMLYLGAEAHSCARKAAELLGLGGDNIRIIESDSRYRIRPDDLAAQLRRDIAAGLAPLAVVASAGTVNTGAIDPLDAIADVCAEHGSWLHVDGAYGAPPVLLLEQFSQTAAALARVDSLAIDPHKWLYVPVDAGLVLLRDGEQARDAFSLVPPYLRTDGGSQDVSGPPWFSEYGFEQTRPFRALKVWMLLRHLGLAGYRQLISHDLEMAGLLARLVEDCADLELLARGLSVCCFRANPAGTQAADLDRLNRTLLDRLQRGGKFFVAGTTVGGAFALRACFVNPGTCAADVELAVSEIRASLAQ